VNHWHTAKISSLKKMNQKEEQQLVVWPLFGSPWQMHFN
jgi:hypothetical protein